MIQEFQLAAALFLPLGGGLVFHGLCMKFGWLAVLATPVDRGRAWRGRRLFGENKTWRGIVAVAIGTALGYGVEACFATSLPAPLSSIAPLSFGLFGLALGTAAMLSELPNSFVKRRFDVGPGEAAAGPWGPVFYILDQVDVLLGVWIVASFVVRPTLPLVLTSAGGVFVLHQMLTVAGYALGMRKTIR